jgi:hypothetical protein
MIERVTRRQTVTIAIRAGVAACIVGLATASLPAWDSAGQTGSGVGIDYHVVATSKTSTMQKELNDAAEMGFRFDTVMGGETAFGGNEVVVVMSRASGTKASRFGYRLLATSKTSTMQKELQDAADAGFQYRGQTVFNTAFGGDEVVCILERDGAAAQERVDYRLVATSKTGTLQKELVQAGAGGYQIVGMTVGKTALGGSELVAITRRVRAQ